MPAAALERQAGLKTWAQDAGSPVPMLRREQHRNAQEPLIPAGLNLEILMVCERRQINFFLFFRGVSPAIILRWLLLYNCSKVKNDLMIALVSTQLPFFHSSPTSTYSRDWWRTGRKVKRMPECRLSYPAQLLLIVIFWELALDELFVANDLCDEINSLFHSLQTFSAKWWRHSKLFVMFIGPGDCFSPQAWDYGLVVLWGASVQ